MTPFDAYKLFHALKLHFTSDTYDYFKYSGVVNANETKFEVRKDKYHFYKLSKKKDLDMFLVSSFMKKPDLWVGDLFSDEYKDAYLDMQKRIQSLEYNFKTEMTAFESLDDALVVGDGGDWPKIVYAYKRKTVSPETMVIVYKVIKCFDYWDAKIDDKLIWPRMKRAIQNYAPFISRDIDYHKYKQILLDLFE